MSKFSSWFGCSFASHSLVLNGVYLDHQLFRQGAFSSHHHEICLPFTRGTKGSSNSQLWVCNMRPCPLCWHTCKCKRELYIITEQEFNPNAALPCRDLDSVCGTTLKIEGKARISCSPWMFSVIMLQDKKVCILGSGSWGLHIGRSS